MARAVLGASNIKFVPHTHANGLIPEGPENISFGQNQGLAWFLDSNLWGNQLLKKNI